MTPDQIAATYDDLAEHWDSRGFNRDNGIPQHERALQFLPRNGAALDVGCGSSGRFIDLLLERGFAVARSMCSSSRSGYERTGTTGADRRGERL